MSIPLFKAMDKKKKNEGLGEESNKAKLLQEEAGKEGAHLLAPEIDLNETDDFKDGEKFQGKNQLVSKKVSTDTKERREKQSKRKLISHEKNPKEENKAIRRKQKCSGKGAAGAGTANEPKICSLETKLVFKDGVAVTEIPKIRHCPTCEEDFEREEFKEHIKPCLYKYMDSMKRDREQKEQAIEAKRKSREKRREEALFGMSIEDFGTEEKSCLCQICQMDLSHLNSLRRNLHVNVCIDKMEVKERSSTAQPLTKDKGARKRIRRLNKEKTQAPAKQTKRKTKGPQDEATQIAMALSSSLAEEERKKEQDLIGQLNLRGLPESADQDKVNEGKKTRKKKNVQPGEKPLLLQLTATQAQSRIAEKVTQLIFPVENVDDIGPTPSPQDSRLSDMPGTKMLCTQDTVQSADMLWQKTALLECDQEADTQTLFYTSTLIPPVCVSRVKTGSNLKHVSWSPQRRKPQEVNIMQQGALFSDHEATPLVASSQTAVILAELDAESDDKDVWIDSGSRTGNAFVDGDTVPAKLRNITDVCDDNRASIDNVVESNSATVTGDVVTTDAFSDLEQDSGDDDIGEASGFCPEEPIKVQEEVKSGSLAALQDCYLTLVDNDLHSNITIFTRNKGTVRAHQVILAARCPSVMQLMTDGIIHLPNTSKEAVLSLMKFLYAGIVYLQPSYLTEVHDLAQWFELRELVTLCQTAKKLQKTSDKDNAIAQSVDTVESVLERERRRSIDLLFQEMLTDSEYDSDPQGADDVCQKKSDTGNHSDEDDWREIYCSQRQQLYQIPSFGMDMKGDKAWTQMDIGEGNKSKKTEEHVRNSYESCHSDIVEESNRWKDAEHNLPGGDNRFSFVTGDGDVTNKEVGEHEHVQSIPLLEDSSDRMHKKDKTRKVVQKNITNCQNKDPFSKTIMEDTYLHRDRTRKEDDRNALRSGCDTGEMTGQSSLERNSEVRTVRNEEAELTCGEEELFSDGEMGEVRTRDSFDVNMSDVNHVAPMNCDTKSGEKKNSGKSSHQRSVDSDEFEIIKSGTSTSDEVTSVKDLSLIEVNEELMQASPTDKLVEAGTVNNLNTNTESVKRKWIPTEVEGASPIFYKYPSRRCTDLDTLHTKSSTKRMKLSASFRTGADESNNFEKNKMSTPLSSKASSSVVDQDSLYITPIPRSKPRQCFMLATPASGTRDTDPSLDVGTEENGGKEKGEQMGYVPTPVGRTMRNMFEEIIHGPDGTSNESYVGLKDHHPGTVGHPRERNSSLGKCSDHGRMSSVIQDTDVSHLSESIARSVVTRRVKENVGDAERSQDTKDFDSDLEITGDNLSSVSKLSASPMFKSLFSMKNNDSVRRTKPDLSLDKSHRPSEEFSHSSHKRSKILDDEGDQAEVDSERDVPDVWSGFHDLDAGCQFEPFCDADTEESPQKNQRSLGSSQKKRYSHKRKGSIEAKYKFEAIHSSRRCLSLERNQQETKFDQTLPSPEKTDQGEVTANFEVPSGDSFLWHDNNALEYSNTNAECGQGRQLSQTDSFKTPVSHQPKKADKKWVPPSPFTPMLDYDAMNTPQLKKEVSKFGVRPVGKKRMKLLLKDIYQQTHQYETDSDYEPGKESLQNSANRKESTCQTSGTPKQKYPPKLPFKQNILLPSSPKQVSTSFKPDCANGGASQGFAVHSNSKSDTSASEDGGSQRSVTSSQESLYSDVPEESFMLEENETSASQQSSQTDLSAKLLQFIKKRPDIHMRMMMYEAVELDWLKKEIQESGIKCPMQKLMDFLDEKCLTFTMKKMCKRNTNRRQPRKKKKQKVPPSAI